MASSNSAQTAEAILPARYHYRVSAQYQEEYEAFQNYMNGQQQCPMLKPTDEFKFCSNVISRSVDSNSVVRLTTLLHHAEQVGCKRFFQEGQDFLRSHLFHPDFPSESLEQLIQRIVPEVRQLFDLDDSFIASDLDNGLGKPRASQCRQFILFLKVVVDI